MLFALAVLDELAAGVPMAGAPDIERTLALSHGATTLAIFAVPGVVAFVLEPFLFVLADRYPRRWFIRAGLAAMALGSFVAALAPGAITLAIAMSIWSVAGGAATALAQATLVDQRPDDRARTMARWTLLSLLGDIGAPFALAVLAFLDLGWRTGFLIVGMILAASTVFATLVRFPDAPKQPDDEREEPLWASIRTALRDRTLMIWLFGLALCDLLDEILVVFASLHVRDDLGASTTWQSITLAAFVGGGALGLVWLERLLARRSESPGSAGARSIAEGRCGESIERDLLVAFGLACAASYIVWIAAPWPWLAAVLMLPVGVTAAPLYPLTSAQCYARYPGRSGLVLAASDLFTPFGLAIPWLLGMLADRAGILAALAVLLAQPLGLAALAARGKGVAKL